MVELSPLTLNFGNVRVRRQSQVQMVQFTNTENSPVNIAQIYLSGKNSPEPRAGQNLSVSSGILRFFSPLSCTDVVRK